MPEPISTDRTLTDGTLTEGLVALLTEKPITPADRAAAARFVLDAVANAIGGRRSEPGRILTDWAVAEPRDSGGRAFVIGALTHILEVDDLHRASVVHPGCVVVPAALVVGARLGASARDVFDALLWGFEAACRVGMAVGPAHYRIWHNTATCGPFGAAVAAGRLLGLSRAALVDALGNAGSQASGLWQFMATGAMTKHLHAGHAASAGLLAADLAARGFSGPPAILEGERGFFRAACPDADPARVLTEPAAPWALTGTSIKPWPSCRHTHPAIDAALALSPVIAGRTVSGVTVEAYRAALDVCDRPAPASPYEAKFSLQHTVAAALADGRIDFASFEAPAREAHVGLAARVTLAVAPDFDAAYPAAWGSRLRVTLADGSVLEASRGHALGDPEAPVGRDALVDKAVMLMTMGGLGRALASRLAASILALGDDETRAAGPLPDFAPFFGLA